MHRNLFVLFFAQAFAQCGPPIVVLLGGIIGVDLAPRIGLATLPVAMMIVGTAVTTIPAAMIMARFSRKTGFIWAAFICALAGLGAAWSISTQNFWLFCLSVFFIGANNAFVQQYRFAVVESVAANKVGTALSVLMLSGVIAAYMGPETAQRLQGALEWGKYSGSFAGLSGLMVVTLCILCFYRNTDPHSDISAPSQRPLLEIMRQPVFVLAVGAGIASYSVMSLIMTATPVSMHSFQHISIEDTTWVIQSHIMAMYLPSLFSGFIIQRIGSIGSIWIGLLLLTICILVGLFDQMVIHYWWSLVLLGVGWNFLFLGGTSLLTYSYSPEERFKVQAINDFAIFSCQALGALGSGVLLSFLGWDWLLAVSAFWIILLFPIIFWVNRSGLGRSPQLS